MNDPAKPNTVRICGWYRFPVGLWAKSTLPDAYSSSAARLSASRWRWASCRRLPIPFSLRIWSFQLRSWLHLA